MPAYRIQSDIFGLEWKLDRIGYRRHIVSVACENLQHTKLKTHSFKLTVVSICHDFIPGFQWGSCYSIFSFMCRSFFVFCPFSFGHCVVCPWFTDSDYPFGIFWPLCCLSFFDLWILITPLVSFGHCVVCPSLIYRFWLPLWYLLAIVLSVLLWFTDSDYPFGILWPLCCLSFFDLQILITPLVSCGHCVVCPSLIYRFWLPPFGIFDLQILITSLWYLWFTDSDYPFGIFKLFFQSSKEILKEIRYLSF
jgi:hypothetical protein